MSTDIYPVRGFFIGKTGKIVKILLVMCLFSYPIGIQADTAKPHPQSTALVAPAAAAAATAAPAIPPDAKTVWVTAYTSDPVETSDHPLITASGGMVHDGEVAANFLPFGTRIQIPALFGDKVFTVEDRTSPKFGGRVDIWMPTINQAVNFGIQHAQIVILDQNLAMQ
jgi:3D (Asp-Asp-Asp) domain-containing protein